VFTISKQFAFSASHVLAGLPDDHPCSRLHGHNYVVELVLSADEIDDTGFVVDYRRLDAFKRYLDTNLDHTHLNKLLGDSPSSELLACFLYDWCADNLEPDAVARLAAVRVSETPTTWAEHRP
jgi:6-pyruvoyltetrahydropterin/6-carboxytetrahydropterin synthase